MLQRLITLVVFTIFVLPSGCALLSHQAPAEDIDKAAALFFQRFNAEQYDTIYDDSASAFKNSQTRQTVTDNLKQIAANGKILAFERMSMTFQGEGKTRMALPVYMTSTDQMKGELTLTFQDESGEWKLFGFAFKVRS